MPRAVREHTSERPLAQLQELSQWYMLPIERRDRRRRQRTRLVALDGDMGDQRYPLRQ